MRDTVEGDSGRYSRGGQGGIPRGGGQRVNPGSRTYSKQMSSNGVHLQRVRNVVPVVRLGQLFDERRAGGRAEEAGERVAKKRVADHSDL